MVAGFDIISHGIFLVMGLFGISVQFKELNVLLLLGNIGIGLPESKGYYAKGIVTALPI